MKYASDEAVRKAIKRISQTHRSLLVALARGPDQPNESSDGDDDVNRDRQPDRIRLSLTTIREGAGKTQADLASALGVDEDEVSRIEGGADVPLSTLRKYASAIGAECDVVFVFPETGHRVTVGEPRRYEDDEEG